MSLRVAVTGLPYFGKRVAASLRRSGVRATYVPTLKEAVKRPRRLVALARADVVYAIGPGVTQNGPLDLVARAGKRVIVHWVGSDVRHALEAYAEGRTSERLIEGATHWADAPWLAEELEPLGIEAEERALPMPIAYGAATPMPEKHRVLVFLPKTPHSAYNVQGTLEVVAALPQLEFTLVGGYLPAGHYPNLRNEGYVTDMAAQYRAHSVFVRLAHHDGLAHSVVEALSFGREAVWNYSLPGVHRVADAKEAVAALREITGRPPALNEAGLETAQRYTFEATVEAAVEAMQGMKR